MANERRTDFFIGKLLSEAGIEYIPNGSNIKEIQDALKTASKKKTGRAGFPEFVGKSKDFIMVIEDKESIDKQALFIDETEQELSMHVSALINYAENGALHYAQQILAKTFFTRIFAFGCTGDEKHHKIRPIYVDENGYKLLQEVENFANFSEENIDRYYKEQVLGEAPVEAVELEVILRKSSELHEMLRNYGQLGDSEKPLVVSAILLALKEDSFTIESLTGDDAKTDGQKIYDALSTYMKRVKVQPETKKEKILNQFTLIKDRTILNQIDDRLEDKNAKLAKTPLRYFTEYLKVNVSSSVVSNSPEDVLGRFYGEFIRYSGGDGQTLGVVLTPRHITEIFCKLVDIQPTDKIFDPCCGTGGFLIAGMHHMLEKAVNDQERERIQKEQIHGMEIREDMFSIATTNMILRGDGKSNLLCDDFLKQDCAKLRKKRYSVGFMNPPYSQAKGKDTAHLSEVHFIKHLLDCMDDGARCIVIVPQSSMAGKTNGDKLQKRAILKKHTLEGVITLNKNTFYGIGTNPCIAVFTAHRPHPKDKYCKFVNFEDDGFIVSKHIGLVETERAKEKCQHLLSCWLHDAPVESKFMVRSTIEVDDEWLHSFYYFNDEIPLRKSFEKTVSDYLTFEFNMTICGRADLFVKEKNEIPSGIRELPNLNQKDWKDFVLADIFDILPGKRLTKADMRPGDRPFVGATDSNNGVTEYVSNSNQSLDSNVLGVNYNGSVGECFYHPYECLFSDDVKRFRLKQVQQNKYLSLFCKVIILQQKSKYRYGYKFNERRMRRQKITLPVDDAGNPDYVYMEQYMKNIETEQRNKYISIVQV
ncbi:MAG: hypothetical protein K0S22_563 [Oscillospiraceae bacterium]|jgi:type I restriction-modification system DNA methylase subunit|nr:hypothetical protein [Oscillospiraceae bacterium]